MQVFRKIEIDAGHRVPFHASKCRHLHGHRYKIVATVEGDVIPSTPGPSDAGMVKDFGVIKAGMMTAIHDVYDHRLILWDRDPVLSYMLANPEIAPGVVTVPCIPTAEELTIVWRDATERALGFRLSALQVFETPNCAALWVA